MTVFVIDASALLAAVFGELSPDRAEQLFARLGNQDAIVPAVFPTEIFNALEMSRRRQRFDATEIEAYARQLVQLAISVRPSPSMAEAAALRALAERHKLTVYDAAYLALARDERLELITLDQDLAAAARAIGLTVTPP